MKLGVVMVAVVLGACGGPSEPQEPSTPGSAPLPPARPTAEGMPPGEVPGAPPTRTSIPGSGTGPGGGTPLPGSPTPTPVLPPAELERLAAELEALGLVDPSAPQLRIAAALRAVAAALEALDGLPVVDQRARAVRRAADRLEQTPSTSATATRAVQRALIEATAALRDAIIQLRAGGLTAVERAETATSAIDTREPLRRAVEPVRAAVCATGLAVYRVAGFEPTFECSTGVEFTAPERAAPDITP